MCSLLQASSISLPALSLPVDPCLGGGSGWWALHQCSTALLALLYPHISLHLALSCWLLCACLACGHAHVGWCLVRSSIQSVTIWLPMLCLIHLRLLALPADTLAPAVLQYYLNPVAWTLCE